MAREVLYSPRNLTGRTVGPPIVSFAFHMDDVNSKLSE